MSVIAGEISHQDKVKTCCGNLIKSHSTPCTSIKSDLEQCFEVKIYADNAWEPKKICKKCYSVLLRWRKRPCTYSHHTVVVEWLPHSDKNCTICGHFASRSIGGRKKKMQKGRGRSPKKLTSNTTQVPESYKFISQDLSCSLFPTLGMPSLERIINHQELLICPICKEVLDAPVAGPCQHIFCLTCFNTWAVHCKSRLCEVTCPECKTVIAPEAVTPPPRYSNTYMYM